MCRINAICNSFKDSPNTLIILQFEVFWHYDIMSDLQMLIKPLQMCIKVYENIDIKICFCDKKCVYALIMFCYSVE
jgi:hypothetical protein